MTLSLMRLTDLSPAGGEDGEDEDLLTLGLGEGSNVLRRSFPHESLDIRLVLSVGDDLRTSYLWIKSGGLLRIPASCSTLLCPARII